MSATIIIPQHGRADLTLACLASIRQHDPHPWPAIVIDDGSPDDSFHHLKATLSASQGDTARASHIGRTRLFQQSHQGLTAAWNRAARQASTRILLFLNNDALTTGPFIEELITPLLQEVRPDASIPTTPLLTGIRRRTESSLPPTIFPRLPTTQFLEGWCFAIRRDDYLRLGGFDETMRIYWSDTDLQCRLLEDDSALDHGLTPPPPNTHPPKSHARFIALPDLPIRHLGHRTTRGLPTRRQQWHADRSAFIAKWSRRSPPTLP
jgi:GT2 family glycosyltransferase